MVVKGKKVGRGRPTSYNEKIANEICERISAGESLTKILKTENFPAIPTVYRWLDANEDFQKQYTRARERQADSFVDLLPDIADDATNDTFTDSRGNVQVDAEVVARSKLRIETRKWLAMKYRPRTYGETAGEPANGTPEEMANLIREQLRKALS